MRAAIYVRVSSEEQAKGFSPDMQERECREYAARQGYTVVGIYKDLGFSGAVESRPDLNRLLADADARRFDVLVTWKFDRLYRVAEFQKRARREMVDWNILWQSATERIDIYTPTGNLQHSIHASFAEWERDTIKERTMAGRRQKAITGRQTVMHRPFGYRIITRSEALAGAEARDGEYEIIPEEAEAVKRIFARCEEGWTLWQIARQLEAEGVATMSGGRWFPSNLGKILHNTVYIGQAYHHRVRFIRSKDPETGQLKTRREEYPPEEWVPIPCPAIITKDTFARVREVLKGNKARMGGRPDRLYPLSGLIKCQECGRNYAGKSAQRGKYRYYTPPVQMRPGDGPCTNVPWTADRAEKGILQVLSQVAQDPAYILQELEEYWRRKDRKPASAAERERLRHEVNDIERQLKALIEKELADPDLASVYAEMKVEKKARRQALLEQMARLPAEPTRPAMPSLRDIQSICEELAKRLQTVEDPQTMRRIFLTVLDQCEVDRAGDLQVHMAIGKLSVSSAPSTAPI